MSVNHLILNMKTRMMTLTPTEHDILTYCDMKEARTCLICSADLAEHNRHMTSDCVLFFCFFYQ